MLLLALSTGCSNSVTDSPTPTPPPVDVHELLRRSGDATGGLSSFRFRLEHNRGGGTPLSDMLVVNEAGGSVLSPDSMSVNFSGKLGNFAVRSSLITLGEESYMTNPLTGSWEEMPREVSPLSFFDPQRGIGSIIEGIEDPTLIPGESEDFRISGTLAVSALEPLLGGSAQGDTARVELSLDAKTLYLKKAVIDGRVTSSEPDGVVRIVTLSHFDEPVSIDRPQ